VLTRKDKNIEKLKSQPTEEDQGLKTACRRSKPELTQSFCAKRREKLFSPRRGSRPQMRGSSRVGKKACGMDGLRKTLGGPVTGNLDDKKRRGGATRSYPTINKRRAQERS